MRKQAGRSPTRFPFVIQEGLYPQIFWICNPEDLLYKVWGNVLPRKMLITSGKQIVDKDINVGVDKNLFTQKFINKLLSDTLLAQDTEEETLLGFSLNKIFLLEFFIRQNVPIIKKPAITGFCI